MIFISIGIFLALENDAGNRITIDRIISTNNQIILLSDDFERKFSNQVQSVFDRESPRESPSESPTNQSSVDVRFRIRDRIHVQRFWFYSSPCLNFCPCPNSCPWPPNFAANTGGFLIYSFLDQELPTAAPPATKPIDTVFRKLECYCELPQTY